MSSDGKSGKPMSIVQSFKQKLIEELIEASDKLKVGEGGENFEKLQQERLAILNKYEKQTESAQEVAGQFATDMKAVHEFAEGGPYRLNDLLVSKDSWPFDTLSQVSSHFGLLPPGYCYRNLVVAPYDDLERPETKNACNLIRLPSAFSSLVDESMNLAGDGIPNRSLTDWLKTQSAQLIRLWSLRVLAERGILRRSELPAVAVQKGGGPWGKPVGSEPAAEPGTTPKLKRLMDEFVEHCMFHYNGQERGSDVEIIAGVVEKRDIFQQLTEIPGGVAALRPLLDHPEIPIRVSAAIYLLLSDPQSALPVLQGVAATWPGDEDVKYSQSGPLNAQRALWMYRDGNLSYKN
jgi:hypothetical protein